MTPVTHHIPDEMIHDWAAGRLHPAFGTVVAAHISLCDTCRAVAEADDFLGGALLDGQECVALAATARERMMAALDLPPPPPRIAASGIFPAAVMEALGGNPPKWRMLGGGIRQQILMADAAASLRLLYIPPGRAVPEHGHGGQELTLVLQGSFSDSEGQFRRGDVEVVVDVGHNPQAARALVQWLAAHPRGRVHAVYAALADKDAQGVVAALDFLTASNRIDLGDEVPDFADGELNAEGKRVVVIGGGDSAMEEATFLTKFAESVTIVNRSENFRASKIMLDRAQDNEQIKWETNKVVERVLEDDGKVGGLELKDVETGETSTLDVTAMFVAIGHDPRSSFLNGQVKLDDNGYVEVDQPSTKTSLPGVFACGDLVDDHYQQAITAAGSGCRAAIDAEQFLAANR